MAVFAVDIDFDGILTDTFGDLADFIPKLIAFALILVVGMFVARLIRRAVGTVLSKIGFDGYIDKAGIGGPLERAGFADSGRFVAQIVYYLVALLVLKLSLSAFGDNDISDALDGLIEFIPKLIVAIVIVIVTGLVANAVGNMIRPALADLDYGDALGKLATAGIWMIGIFAAIDQIEFAQDIVDTLFTAIIGSLSAILVLKFGIGGIWAARDRFWPNVYDRLSITDSSSNESSDTEA
jgi:flagellar biosynthesis protein FliQ